jgi:hypothetical protein
MLSEAALEKLAAVGEILRNGDEPLGLDAASEYIIDRWHNAYLGGGLPDGWELNDDLTLADMEVYYAAFDAEDGGNLWAERGRAIRAAVIAGWIRRPADLGPDDVGKLKPAAAAQIKNALDRHYFKLITADPNS